MNAFSYKYILRKFLQFSTVFFLVTAYCINIYFVLKGVDSLMDFGSFIAAGKLASEFKDPYSNDSPLILSVSFPKINHSGSAPNLNPPISVLVFERIASFPPLTSINIWRITSMMLYGIAMFAFINTRENIHPPLSWKLVWMLSLAGFWHTVELGQIYILLYLLALGSAIYSEKRQPLLAGVLLGALIAIKPNFVFWAFALGVAGFWQLLIYAGITSLLISLIPLYFYGIVIYKQWIEATTIFTPNLLIFPGNNSLQGLTARFNSPETGIVIGLLLASAILFIVYKYKPDITKINLLAIITSLFISPIAWTGYTLFVVPSLMKIKKWEWQHWTVAAIFSVPFYIILAFFQNNFFNFIFFGWFYGWGLLILLINEIVDITKSKNEGR